MNPADFEQLKPGRSECPSDVMVHRLRAGELPEERAEATRRHVDGCALCAARMARLEAGFGAWPEVDPVRMLAAIRRGAGERPRGWLTRWRTSWRAALAPVALAAAAVIAVVALRPAGVRPGEEPGLRAKGGPTLHVFRQQQGVVVEALSGERLTPGESLQLTVDVPADSLVRVAGIDAAGQLYAVWPRDEAGAFARMKAGSGQRIPGAITPDETPGRETLYVIACPPKAAPPACRSQGAAQPPECSEGCLASPFVIVKGQ